VEGEGSRGVSGSCISFRILLYLPPLSHQLSHTSITSAYCHIHSSHPPTTLATLTRPGTNLIHKACYAGHISAVKLLVSKASGGSLGVGLGGGQQGVGQGVGLVPSGASGGSVVAGREGKGGVAGAGVGVGRRLPLQVSAGRIASCICNCAHVEM
jgi:hypothetical protein